MFCMYTGQSYGGSAFPHSHCAKSAKIRWDKADNDAAWAGLSGYVTNSTKPVGEVIGDYRRLGEIEEAFRQGERASYDVWHEALAET